MLIQPLSFRILRLATLALLVQSLGCRETKPAASQKPLAGESSPPAVALAVAVVGDDALVEGVRLLRGEWKARTGGELSVEATPLGELQQPTALSADVVIFPSRHLGTLAERGLLRAVRPSVLESAALGHSDIYPAIRNGEMRFGGHTMALPLGSPPLLLCWRPEAGSAAPNNWPPETWQSYRQGLGLSTDHPGPAAHPQDDRAAASVLIARSLAYTESQHRMTALFDAGDMQPRIEAPTFVRALAELVEERSAPQALQAADLAAAVAMVSDGRALAALGWPSLLPAGAPPSAEPSAVRFAPLPLAEEVYSQTRNHWENQSLRIPVVLLGVEGRLIGVSRASRNAVAAFRLAQWLSSGDVAVQLSSRSRGALWFRASQASSRAKWTGGAPAEDGAALTELVSASLSSDSAVLVPRVPGIDEYLVALGKAVNASAAGEAGAAAALKAVADQWEVITERLGRDEQVRAYRRHLGIETMDEP